MRRPKDLKSSVCTEAVEVDVTDKSEEVRAHYPGKSPTARKSSSARKGGTMPLVAAFMALTPTNICITQSVVFTNNSTGSITNSAWSFGDGNTSNLNGTSVTNNASDTHLNLGTKIVILIASGSGGSWAATNYVLVLPKPTLKQPFLSDGKFIFGGTNVPGGTGLLDIDLDEHGTAVVELDDGISPSPPQWTTMVDPITAQTQSIEYKHSRTVRKLSWLLVQIILALSRFLPLSSHCQLQEFKCWVTF